MDIHMPILAVRLFFALLLAVAMMTLSLTGKKANGNPSLVVLLMLFAVLLLGCLWLVEKVI